MGTEIREKIQKVKENFIKYIEILKVKPCITPQNKGVNTKKNYWENHQQVSSLGKQSFRQLRQNMKNKVGHGNKILEDHEKNFQEIWSNLKRPNFNLTEIDESLVIQMKEMNSFFKEVMSENF